MCRGWRLYAGGTAVSLTRCLPHHPLQLCSTQHSTWYFTSRRVSLTCLAALLRKCGQPEQKLLDFGAFLLLTQVLHAEAAGASAAVVYDDSAAKHKLVVMTQATPPVHVAIPAAFIRREDGEWLLRRSSQQQPLLMVTLMPPGKSPHAALLWTAAPLLASITTLTLATPQVRVVCGGGWCRQPTSPCWCS
jgi:hypothetical protein